MHGINQANSAVTYRFAEPGQPLPLVLSQSYSTDNVIRIPVEPKTIGDHIRRRRLDLKLLQKDVAKNRALRNPTRSVLERHSSAAVPDSGSPLRRPW